MVKKSSDDKKACKLASMQVVNGCSVIETNDIGVCDGQAARV